VQDLESVITTAAKEIPGDVAERVTLMSHDFFTEQPIRNADVYIFRWIFHTWSDKYCIRILRNLIPALKPGAKIIVNDNVLPQPGSISKWQEKKFRYCPQETLVPPMPFISSHSGFLDQASCNKVGLHPPANSNRHRAIDLAMTQIQNSRERELDDWRNLFTLADDRFEFQEAKRPDGSNLWIMTVEWKG
jgi:hypothetical protein